jgi:predicted nucleotidyltransferase component of viral defense system
MPEKYTEIQEQRIFIMRRIAQDLNGKGVILKGGTGLLLCYGLDRFSEDMDFDIAPGFSFDKVCESINLSYEKLNIKINKRIVKKDTDTTKRLMYHYDTGELAIFPYPLKIEFSTRQLGEYNKSEIVNVNGINTYKIEKMALTKLNAFLQRCKTRDIYDINFLLTKYPEAFTREMLTQIKTLNLNYIEAAFEAQKSEDSILKLVDSTALVLSLFDKVDNLLVNEKESIIQQSEQSLKESKFEETTLIRCYPYPSGNYIENDNILIKLPVTDASKPILIKQPIELPAAHVKMKTDSSGTFIIAATTNLISQIVALKKNIHIPIKEK